MESLWPNIAKIQLKKFLTRCICVCHDIATLDPTQSQVLATRKKMPFGKHRKRRKCLFPFPHNIFHSSLTNSMVCVTFVLYVFCILSNHSRRLLIRLHVKRFVGREERYVTFQPFPNCTRTHLPVHIYVEYTFFKTMWNM